jgi:diacylglycerol O-acyltransferase / wax synthase
VTERLSALDVSFLYLETPTTPMHVGSVARFDPAGLPFDFEALCELVGRRIGLVPRYRQKVQWVPGHIANPVWVDDEDFDISYHVRRSALPKPGTDDQLRTLVARLQARPLDRSRPLWEMYLVEGLADGRFAVITKTHHAMVDGVSAMDIGTVILDVEPTPRETPDEQWEPRPTPSRVDLFAAAVGDTLRRPSQALDNIRGGLADVRATTGRVFGTAAGVAAFARTSLRSPPSSPLNSEVGEQRRFGMTATSLDDYKRIRKTHGGTINDVVLATVAGALRSWLLTRGEPVTPSSTVRAMVPVSVRSPADADVIGNRVSSYFVDLPVGEPDPVVRLHQVGFAMQAHKESGQWIGADAMVKLTGFAPPSIHSAAARLGSGLSHRLFNVLVTNVPGPQFPLYAAGAKMIDCYPVVPLSKNQAVSIGLTSYNGGVFYGMNCDRDSMPDIDVLAGCMEESLDELMGTAT